MNIIKCPLQTAAVHSGHCPAIIEKNKIITYRDFHNTVNFIVQPLKRRGIIKGQRISIIAENNSKYLFILYALWRIKAVPCLLNPRLPQQTLMHQLKTINCRVLITDIPTILQSKAISLKKIRIAALLENTLVKNEIKKFSFKLNQHADIMFTSGSSDKPKAILHTLGNHYYSALGSNAHIRVHKNDRWLLTLPLYHVSGLSILFRVLLQKAAIVITQSQNTITKTLLRGGITHISLVPTQLTRLLKHKHAVQVLKKLKVILIGGSAIPVNLIEQSIKLNLPIYITYGLTEMASQVATSSKIKTKKGQYRTKILKYRNVRIATDQEILVKGKTLFKGYVTKNKIISPFDNQGWFKTKDLGCLSPVHDLQVLGRKDHMFISGGRKYSPRRNRETFISAQRCGKSSCASYSRSRVPATPNRLY